MARYCQSCMAIADLTRAMALVGDAARRLGGARVAEGITADLARWRAAADAENPCSCRQGMDDPKKDAKP